MPNKVVQNQTRRDKTPGKRAQAGRGKTFRLLYVAPAAACLSRRQQIRINRLRHQICTLTMNDGILHDYQSIDQTETRYRQVAAHAAAIVRICQTERTRRMK